MRVTCAQTQKGLDWCWAAGLASQISASSQGDGHTCFLGPPLFLGDADGLQVKSFLLFCSCPAPSPLSAFLQLAGRRRGRGFSSPVKLRSLPSQLLTPAHIPPTLAGTWGVSLRAELSGHRLPKSKIGQTRKGGLTGSPNKHFLPPTVELVRYLS